MKIEFEKLIKIIYILLYIVKNIKKTKLQLQLYKINLEQIEIIKAQLIFPHFPKKVLSLFFRIKFIIQSILNFL